MRDGCAPSACFGRGIRKTLDEGRAREDAPDGFALYADAFAVYETHGSEPRASRFEQVRFDDAFDIARRDGVKVEDIADFESNRFGKGIEGIEVVFARIRLFASARPVGLVPLVSERGTHLWMRTRVALSWSEQTTKPCG